MFAPLGLFVISHTHIIDLFLVFGLDRVTSTEGVKATCVCGRLTMTDRVTFWCAHSQLYLTVLVTDGAGQAGVEGALPVRVGIVHALLAHRVVFVFAVREHALARRAHRTRHALTGYPVEEKIVVADADGVVGVGAWRLHPHQAEALCACPALLCVTVVL